MQQRKPSPLAMALAAGNRDLGGLAHQGSTTTLPGAWAGMLQPGNIDLTHRPHVQNPDGSVSTVKSASFGVGGQEVLVPEVVNDRVVSARQALAHYLATGQNLGTFADPAAANRYAIALHLQQAAGLR